MNVLIQDSLLAELRGGALRKNFVTLRAARPGQLTPAEEAALGSVVATYMRVMLAKERVRAHRLLHGMPASAYLGIAAPLVGPEWRELTAFVREHAE